MDFRNFPMDSQTCELNILSCKYAKINNSLLKNALKRRLRNTLDVRITRHEITCIVCPYHYPLYKHVLYASSSLSRREISCRLVSLYVSFYEV